MGDWFIVFCLDCHKAWFGKYLEAAEINRGVCPVCEGQLARWQAG